MNFAILDDVGLFEKNFLLTFILYGHENYKKIPDIIDAKTKKVPKIQNVINF